jgi:NAD(P)-dependent dehydrogenase (short-subunit alcohol dehydrogenase family)
MMKLSGYVCIVTGATGGLGRTLAQQFWAQGASLVLSGRNETALRALAGLSPVVDNQRIVTHVCDLTDPAQASALISRTVHEFGLVTALVNNAAILGPIGPAWETTTQEWEETIQVNFLAPVILSRLVVPVMKKARYGKIVNLSGGGATGPRPNFGAYAASKTALVRFTEVLAHETRGMGIDVNCIAPGILRTKMFDTMLAQPVERIGDSEYVRIRQLAENSDESLQRAASLAVLLVSHDSDGVSGRLVSAVWDPWETLPQRRGILDETDIYTLRRIVPKDRGYSWS